MALLAFSKGALTAKFVGLLLCNTRVEELTLLGFALSVGFAPA
jgi:hypothetical protein